VDWSPAQHPLPYADCFAATLASAHKATLATSDQDFAPLNKKTRHPLDYQVAAPPAATVGARYIVPFRATIELFAHRAGLFWWRWHPAGLRRLPSRTRRTLPGILNLPAE
jgi:hypothetical protein